MVKVGVGILLNKNHQVLIDKRPEGKIFAGFWEFPGGKIEAGETVVQAVIREFEEELGIDTAIEDWQPFYQGNRDGDVFIDFLITQTDVDYFPKSLEHQEFRWENIANLDATTFPPLNADVIAELKAKELF